MNTTWYYGVAHHFKGLDDGIEGSIKRKVYQDVPASKVIIKDAKHFAEYANQVTNIKVEYLGKSEVVTNDVSNAVEIKGNLKLHHTTQTILAHLK